MMTKRWLFACFSVLLLTGMRNPFQPPEDLCRMAELSAWRYQGAVIQEDAQLVLCRMVNTNGGGSSSEMF